MMGKRFPAVLRFDLLEIGRFAQAGGLDRISGDGGFAGGGRPFAINACLDDGGRGLLWRDRGRGS
jgi:hypothetical protein